MQKTALSTGYPALKDELRMAKGQTKVGTNETREVEAVTGDPVGLGTGFRHPQAPPSLWTHLQFVSFTASDTLFPGS